jgi:hypothetical protein
MKIKPIPPGHAGFDRITEAVTTEFGQLMDLVRQALREKLRGTPGMSDYYCDVSAIYADRVVSRVAGRLMAYPYTLNADNTVTVGDGAEVVMQFANVREAVGSLQPGDTATFREAADGSIEVTIIKAGVSANGVMYPDAALREAVALFEGARVFNKADVVHKAGGGKDVAALLGGIYSVRFIEGASPDTGRLVGTFRPLNDADPVVVKMTEAVKRGMQGLMGLSIDADARTAKAGKVRTVRQFTRVHSVDLIVEPGAGGGLDRLTEAATAPSDSTNPQPSAGDAMLTKLQLIAALAVLAPQATRLTEAATESQLFTGLADACAKHKLNMADVLAAAVAPTAEADLAKLLEAAKTPAPAAGQQRVTEGAAVMTQAEFDSRMRLQEARLHARAAVAASNLPQPAKDKLLPELLARERLTEADVDAAIKNEREYVARFVESGRPTGGMPRIEVGDRPKAMQDMLDAFFDDKHKDHRQVRSLRECYIEMTGDRYVTGEIDRARLTESVGTDTFADVLGNSITRRMQRSFNDAVAYQAWREVCTVTSVSDFRSQERTEMGGFGDFPVVAERGPYLDLTDPSDDKATYTVAKRGGKISITFESIKNDDVAALRRIPVNLGRAAQRQLYGFVFNVFAANAAIYDGLALYHASHNNLFTTALSGPQYAAHRLAMMKQTGRDTGGKRMGIGPSMLLVPMDLEETAADLFRRNTNNDKTFVQSLSPTIIPVASWTDATDWVTLANKDDGPVLEVGFLDGQEEPTLLLQDSPTEGSVFTNDMISYKLRHIYGATVLVDGFKFTTKAVVAG